MSYYRGTNCPQTYIPRPSPSSHHDTYWRMPGGPYPTPPPMPQRLSEENLARLDHGQARSSIFMSQTYGTNRPFPSFQPSSRYSIGASHPHSRSGTMYSSPSLYSSDSRRTPTPSISPYSSPGAPLSRIHSPFPSPPPPPLPPPYISPNPKRYLDANTPPRPRFSPSHNYPDPRPLVHRSPTYQHPTPFDNRDRDPYYGRTRFPPNNVPGAFSHLQNPRYTPRGTYESDEEDSDSGESGDSEFSTGSSLTSGSEFFEEDSYDGDYEDATIYESPGDAATL